MINDPFFRSYPSRQTRPVMVQQAHRNSSPKVVSVPIHFVSSEQPQVPSSESAALKIQKVFRGFLVRKCVKKISSIRNEVCEVETRIYDTEIAELIRRDAKERLRVNETLMSLLFKLDSIRGVDFGVRDFRKAVIKKAIALQEKLDSIVTVKFESDAIELESANSTGIRDEVVADSVNSTAATDSVMNADSVIDSTKEVVKEIDKNCNPIEAVEDCGAEDLNFTDDRKRNIQTLEKLMDDNEKIMKLMSEMLERNEMQTRMLNSLSQRVELLEKAFMCDRSMRKKKKCPRHSA